MSTEKFGRVSYSAANIFLTRSLKIHEEIPYGLKNSNVVHLIFAVS